MTTWILAYLLTGFVIHFVGAQVLKIKPNDSTAWETAAVILWPITVCAAAVQCRKE